MKKGFKKFIIIIAIIVLIAGIGTGVWLFTNRKDKENENKEATNNTVETTSKYEATGTSKMIEPASSFAGGSGTKADPYQISSAEELQYFANLFDSECTSKEESKKYAKAFFTLTEDIEINTNEEMEKVESEAPTYTWKPISDRGFVVFEGSFDGNGHYISGLFNVSDDKEAYLGLFGETDGADINNLTIKNSYFRGIVKVSSIGGIVGYSTGTTFENCKVENISLNGMSSYIGGIVGNASGNNYSIKNCSSSGKSVVAEYAYVGGIAGSIYGDCTVENCINDMNIEGKDNGISAGIVCYAESENGPIKVLNCINNGTIKSENGENGGIIEQMTVSKSDIIVEGCKNTGEIYNDGTISGGIVAQMEYNTTSSAKQLNCRVTNCQNSGNVTCGKHFSGGIIGRITPGLEFTYEVSKCENIGNVKGKEVGGIVGDCKFGISHKDETQRTVKITNNKNSGEVSSDTSKSIGGIIGNIDTYSANSKDVMTINLCTNTGVLKAKTPSWVGGIVGKIDESKGEQITISNCKNSGNFEFSVTENNNQNKEKTSGKDWKNYAGGIVAVGNANTKLSSNTNTGKLNEEGASFEGIIFDEECCYKFE